MKFRLKRFAPIVDVLKSDWLITMKFLIAFKKKLNIFNYFFVLQSRRRSVSANYYDTVDMCICVDSKVRQNTSRAYDVPNILP